MNAQNAKEFLSIIQAMTDDKTIQYQIGHGLWHDIEWVDTIEGYASEYRIKPEPRTFEMWLTPAGAMYSIKEIAAERRIKGWELITVQEVLK